MDWLVHLKYLWYISTTKEHKTTRLNTNKAKPTPKQNIDPAIFTIMSIKMGNRHRHLHRHCLLVDLFLLVCKYLHTYCELYLF